MTIVSEDYGGELARIDLLRQMYHHRRALEELNAVDAIFAPAIDGISNRHNRTGLPRRFRWLPRQLTPDSNSGVLHDRRRAASADTVGLRVRILRGLHEIDAAGQILEGYPAERDDLILRENRIAVLDRLNEVEAVEDLRRTPFRQPLAAQDHRHHERIAVAFARFDAARGNLGAAVEVLDGLCMPLSEFTDGVVYGWWLHFMLRQGDIKRAQSHALDLVKHVDHTHRTTAAHVLARLELSDIARAVLREVTEAHPSYPGGWRRLLSTLRNVGAFEEARIVLETINDIDVVLPESALPFSTLHSVSLRDHPHIRLEQALLLHARFDGVDQRPLHEAESVARLTVNEAPNYLDGWWVLAQTMRAGSQLSQLRDLASSAPEPAQSNVLVEYGRALADRSHWEDAVAVYLQALAIRPANREAHLGIVSALARQTIPAGVSRPDALSGRGFSGTSLVEAVERLREHLSDDAVIMSLAAERLAQNGHYPLAVTIFEQVRCRYPQHYLALAGLIRTFGWSRRFAEVPDPDDAYEEPVVVLARGMLDADAGRTLVAHKRFADLYELVRSSDDPGRRETSALVALWLAISWRWQHCHEQAQRVIEEALAPPADAHGPAGTDRYFRYQADLHDELGWNWFDRHAYVNAVECFRTALTINPRHVGAVRGMIQSYRALGEPDVARAWGDRGRALHPQDANVCCEIAWLYGEMDRFTEARAALTDGLTREVSHPAALEWRIVYLCKQGWYPEAQVAAQQARGRRAESPTLAEAICSVPLQAGAWSDSLRVARELSQLRPDDSRFAVMRAAIQDQVSTSDHAPDGTPIGDDALTALERPDFADCPDVIAMRIRMLRRRHRIADAINLIDTLSDDMLELPDVTAEVAEVNLMQAETTAHAFGQLARLNDRIPWSPRWVRHYALALASFDRLEAALELVRQAIAHAEHSGDQTPVELLCLYGELAIRFNRFDEARAAAKQAIVHPARQVLAARLLMIDSMAATGDLDEAHQWALDLRTSRPVSRRGRLVLARTLEYIGRGPEAATLLGTIDTPLASDRSLIVYAAWLRRTVGDYVVAKRMMAAASKLMPNSAGIQSAYAWALLEHGQVVEARTVFAALDAPQHPPQDRALGKTGVAWCRVTQATFAELNQEGFQESLLSQIREACELDYRVSETNIIAAMVNRLLANATTDPAIRRSRMLEALQYAQRALDMSHVSVCHRLVGRILYELRDVAGALQHFEASIRLHPYQGDYAGLGLVKLSLGDHSGAIDTLQEGINRLAGGAAAAPRPDQHVDLYATLGAVHLDIDLRSGQPGENTRQALQYLRQAVETEPHHLFAVHNYAIALSHSGAHLDAERLIRHTLAETDPARDPGTRPWSRLTTVLRRGQPIVEVAAWADREDILALQLRLANMLRARENLVTVTGLISTFRRRRTIAQARTYRPDATTAPRARVTTPGNTQDRRLARAGTGLAVASIVATIAAWIIWASQTHPSSKPLSLLDMLGLTGAFTLTFVSGLFLPRISSIKLGTVEISYTERASSIAGVLDLPTRAAHPMGFGRLDSVGAQWTARWSSETRLPRLGPTSATLISGYYSSRDQVLPWRRR